MRTWIKIILILLLPALTKAQYSFEDSLRNNFKKAPEGSLQFIAARHIYDHYEELNRDSAYYYADQMVLIAEKFNQKIAAAYCLVSKAYQLIGLGKFGEALDCLLRSFAIAEKKQNEKNDDWNLPITGFEGNKRLLSLSFAHHMFALLMDRTGNTEQQIVHLKQAANLGLEVNRMIRVLLANMNLGQCYLQINKPDSAFLYEKEAERLSIQIDFKKYLGNIDVILGDIHHSLGDQTTALQYYYQGIQTSIEQENPSSLCRDYLRLIKYHLESGNNDSALYYAVKNLLTIKSLGLISGQESDLGIGYEYVYLCYSAKNEFDSAFKYMELALVTKDSLAKVRINNLTEFQKLTYAEQFRLQNLEKEKVIYQNKVRTYFMLAGIGILLLFAIIFYRNNRQKHEAKVKIEQAYDNLKATQQQLIHSEKMSSLGELTAGIAHEIQNPLNFVNNFSEINKELIEELNVERLKPNAERDEQLENEILNDIKENEEKINHHGKRADAIVKGMLQHSRSSSGQKEPTDINALCDEYLRLSYHGFRAKDKSFNATMKTDFDETIGNINVIPQDIGRVILNLINNAFYAVNEKQKQMPPSPKGVNEVSCLVYEPVVTVTTKRLGPPPAGGDRGRIEIRVADNGNGIPQKVLDKIFQPFFTTKPTGQGTGLGLSLSYDIVKAHGGELKVETNDGQGAEFIILLL